MGAEAVLIEDTNPPLYEYFYVARQPIFDNHNNTYGYELLFRSGADKDVAEIIDQDYATLCVATSGFAQSREGMDQSKKIFINFTENLILEKAPRGLPPRVTVVELLETIVPSEKIIQEILELKKDGYIIAVDDYEGGSEQRDLLDIADIIKVDILNKSFEEIREIYAGIKDKKALKLGEKVDSREMFNFLKELGFDLYQGFYFAKPENMNGKKLKSSQISKIRILKIFNDPDLNPNTLIDIIGVDPGITYRLLRFINSAAFGFSIKIDSVARAVVLLGVKRLKYWIRMAVMSDLTGDDKTPELYILALNRGKLLEELAVEGIIKVTGSETMFLFGMLSLIDVMLGVPLEEVLEELPLSEEMISGYTDEASVFFKYLQLAKAIEMADSERLNAICLELNFPQKKVAEASIRSTAWTNTVANAMVEGSTT
ncbi:MAG: HDOD domain-containing protein [Proteobacteria bacterium]|nr:HDOD domain-containing protein [Pseudomonadota bacterium]MBU4471020.1 HDOD domain-containing protein [Pseudomonadota bacterium]MCG2753620.1 HDOD domain-containing protein [Desulfobacteraceae bacterium]